MVPDEAPVRGAREGPNKVHTTRLGQASAEDFFLVKPLHPAQQVASAPHQARVVTSAPPVRLQLFVEPALHMRQQREWHLLEERRVVRVPFPHTRRLQRDGTWSRVAALAAVVVPLAIPMVPLHRSASRLLRWTLGHRAVLQAMLGLFIAWRPPLTLQ